MIFVVFEEFEIVYTFFATFFFSLSLSIGGGGEGVAPVLPRFLRACTCKGERKKFLKNCQFTSYAIIFGQKTFFSIIKLVFRGKSGFYLFCYNAIFKDRVLFK